MCEQDRSCILFFYFNSVLVVYCVYVLLDAGHIYPLTISAKNKVVKSEDFGETRARACATGESEL